MAERFRKLALVYHYRPSEKYCVWGDPELAGYVTPCLTFWNNPVRVRWADGTVDSLPLDYKIRYTPVHDPYEPMGIFAGDRAATSYAEFREFGFYIDHKGAKAWMPLEDVPEVDIDSLCMAPEADIRCKPITGYVHKRPGDMPTAEELELLPEPPETDGSRQIEDRLRRQGVAT